MATSWAEAGREAMFKRVEGGFIFRVPRVPGLVPRHYMVTEAQKSEICRLMRPQFTPKSILLLVLFGIGIFLVVVVLVLEVLWMRASGNNRPIHQGDVQWIVFILVGLNWVVMRRSAQKRIGPVLEGARHTEQRITLRERNETYARLLPLPKLLAAGVACALVAAFFASVLFNLCYGRLCFGSPMNPTEWLMVWFSLALFALLAVRLFYLAILKLSLGPSA
jgi:hypothetical protein